jgi:hypothetical protein
MNKKEKKKYKQKQKNENQTKETEISKGCGEKPTRLMSTWTLLRECF